MDDGDKEEERGKKRRKTRRRVLRAAAGAAAAASLTVGSLFSSADELLNVQNDEETQAQAAIVSVGKTPGISAADAVPRPTVRDRARAWLMQMPAAVRALVLLPFYLAGQVGIEALSALWSALAPVWNVVLGVLLNVLLLAVLFAVVYKLLFPGKSLRELFRKKRWIPLLCCALALSIADAVLRATVDGYTPVALVVKIVLGFGALTLCAYRLLGKRRMSTSAIAQR